MNHSRFTSIAEQVAQVLREGLRQDRWRGTMPGRLRLADELGVNHKTANAALQILEDEGVLVPRGAGRQREIVKSSGCAPSSLRMAILLYEPEDLEVHYIVELRHQLAEAGHSVHFASKTMCELGMNLTRIAHLVQQTQADAWIVVAGSREVLEWFAARPTPTFALFGRLISVPLASTSPKKAEAMKEVVDRLVALGHHRIVMLAREDRRKPEPGFFERLFYEKLASCGIQTSAYNLPEWGDNPEELQRILNSLFRHTPPTAIIIADLSLFFAVQTHLARLGFIVPDNVSLVSTDASPYFEWCRPTIAHISWESNPVVKRVLKWADNISRGKKDHRKTTSLAKFVDGGTIGPAPRSTKGAME